MKSNKFFRVKQLVENSELEKRLFKLYEDIFNLEDESITIGGFRKKFKKSKFTEILFLNKNGVDIGFSTIQFYDCKNLKNTTLIRPSVGVIKQKRDAKQLFPASFLVYQILKYKLFNPFKNIYLISVVVNPIVYASIGKYWAKSYPKPNIKYTKKIELVRNECIKYFGFKKYSDDIIKLPSKLTFSQKEIERFEEMLKSGNKYVQFYVDKIKEYRSDKGILSTTPINFYNLIMFGVIILKKQHTKKITTIYK